MPVAAEVVSYLLSNDNLTQKVHFQIILQCAPLLKGIKGACTMNIEKRFFLLVQNAVGQTDISCRILSQKDDKYLLLLYRKEWLNKQMGQQEMKEFLCQFGYHQPDLPGMLRHLCLRAQQFAMEGMGFPHEIGAFLGYPLSDVQGFLEHQGRHALMTGYWKVYSNPLRAKIIFDSYDRAKICAVNEYLTGRSIAQITGQAAV